MSHSCCIVSFTPVHYIKHNGSCRHWHSSGDSREIIAGESVRKWRFELYAELQRSWADLDRIRAHCKQTRTNGCTDKVSFKGCAVTQPCGKPDPSLPWWEKGGSHYKIEKCKKDPTVSVQVTQSPGPLKGSFLWRAGCVFWRLSVLPSSPWAKVIKLRTKTQFFSLRLPKHVFVTGVSDDVCPMLFFLMLAGVDSPLSHL